MKIRLTAKGRRLLDIAKGHKITRTLTPPPRLSDVDFMTGKKPKDTKGGNRNRKH